jgi:hypothetical protein
MKEKQHYFCCSQMALSVGAFTHTGSLSLQHIHLQYLFDGHIVDLCICVGMSAMCCMLLLVFIGVCYVLV